MPDGSNAAPGTKGVTCSKDPNEMRLPSQVAVCETPVKSLLWLVTYDLECTGHDENRLLHLMALKRAMISEGR
jgi:hypothetical protein